MSYIDRTAYIEKFGGDIWYVNKGSGSDTNSGTRPDAAFETIGAGITALSTGDAIHVAAGTYTETGLDFDTANCEMWFELGAIIKPASGTALTVSGNYCKVWCQGGSLKVDPDGANTTGVLVSGAFCYISDVRVSCDSVADIGFDITGNGCVLDNCRCSAPLIAAFKIQGDKIKLDDCCTGGEVADTSIGFWVTNSCDKCRIKNSGSQGHATAGFQVDTGCTNGVFKDCSSGGGDGRWSDADHAFVWSDFTYDDEVHNVITFAGAPTAYNIFKVTGAVRISNIFGSVETVIPNTASTVYLQLYSSNGTVDITDAPGVDVDSAVVGALLVRNGPSTDALDLADPNATPAVAENTSWRDPKTAIDVVKDNGADTYIRLVLSAALASGAIDWHCHWEPLSDDGFLEAA